MNRIHVIARQEDIRHVRQLFAPKPWWRRLLDNLRGLLKPAVLIAAALVAVTSVGSLAAIYLLADISNGSVW